MVKLKLWQFVIIYFVLSGVVLLASPSAQAAPQITNFDGSLIHLQIGQQAAEETREPIAKLNRFLERVSQGHYLNRLKVIQARNFNPPPAPTPVPVAELTLSDGTANQTWAGEMKIYNQQITNQGQAAAEVALTAISAQNWLIAWQSTAFSHGQSQSTLVLEPGQSVSLQLYVSVPNSANGQTPDTVTITATPVNNAGVAVSTQYQLTGYARNPNVLKFGVDFGPHIPLDDLTNYDIPQSQNMGATYMRVLLPWHKIEATQGQYDWSRIDTILLSLRRNGMKPLFVVYGGPTWATSLDCGPIDDKVAFERFLQTTLLRYGPYVDAWEFTNEPDAKERYKWGPIIGCWGLRPAEYVEHLKIFHTQVKTLDPGALVMFGSLAYDNWEIFEESFFERALQAGAGPYFDVVGFHYYPINPNRFPTLTSKGNELRQTMERNGVYGKRVWVTETSTWVNQGKSVEEQRNFIVKDLSQGFCNGIDNIFWFAVRQEVNEPTLYRWLINREHQPDNGYSTFQHLTQILNGATCQGRYNGVPDGVEAYQFQAQNKTIYILWGNAAGQQVSLPAAFQVTQVNRDGTNRFDVFPQNGQVTVSVGPEPIFVEVTQ